MFLGFLCIYSIQACIGFVVYNTVVGFVFEVGVCREIFVAFSCGKRHVAIDVDVTNGEFVAAKALL